MNNAPVSVIMNPVPTQVVPLSVEPSAIVAINDNGSSGNGQVQFRSLLDQGILVRGDDGQIIGSSGFERFWDSCSNTVSLYPVFEPT